MSEARPAATVIVFRKNGERLELLMLQRSRKSGFFPSAWVFPGGRVDPSDREVACIGEVPNASERAFIVAAIRECFEEAGLWLGQGTPREDLREKLNQYEATLLDQPDLVADLERMIPWSWWITPEEEPKRYDTRFFLACLSEDEEVLVEQDHHETVACRWLTPAEAVQGHKDRKLFMAPPTYLILRELRGFSDLEELWQHALTRKIYPIMPVHRKDRGEFEILLPGHPDHPQQESDLETTRVTLKEGRWWLD